MHKATKLIYALTASCEGNFSLVSLFALCALLLMLIAALAESVQRLATKKKIKKESGLSFECYLLALVYSKRGYKDFCSRGCICISCPYISANEDASVRVKLSRRHIATIHSLFFPNLCCFNSLFVSVWFFPLHMNSAANCYHDSVACVFLSLENLRLQQCELLLENVECRLEIKSGPSGCKEKLNYNF